MPSLNQPSIRKGILINLPPSLPFHPSTFVYDIESTARKSDTFAAVVSVNQESASGQVNYSTLVTWVNFKFGMCLYILLTVVQPIRHNVLIHPLCTPPSVIYTSTVHLTLQVSGEGSEASFFDFRCQIEVALMLYKLPLIIFNICNNNPFQLSQSLLLSHSTTSLTRLG